MGSRSLLPSEVTLAPDPDHEIDLSAGQFDRTSAAQLQSAFRKAVATRSHHLCIFFHGGLVSRDSGIGTARELVQAYTDAGAYPFFFIWNSDLLTVIGEFLKPHQQDTGFVEAANRAVMEGAKRIAAVLNDADLKAGVKRPSHTLLDLEALAEFAEPYDRAWFENAGAQLPLSPPELAEFGKWLLGREPEARRRARFTSSRVKGPRNPLGRVIERLNSHHDHGLYTTVIEELLIALGLADKLGGPIWGRMKTDIDAAFAEDDRAGGTAFLRNLESAYAQHPDLRVTLIGHSAGTIYVQRFVEAFDTYFQSHPERQLEVMMIAAALSFDRMNSGLAVLKRRVSAIRTFAMTDKRESGYWEIPFVYNKSLLYIVSSLCEQDPEADKPLVGMQRYWSGARPYDQHDIRAIIEFVQRTNSVWSPTVNTAPPGFRSQANRHGGFPTEPVTNQSVCYALKKGV